MENVNVNLVPLQEDEKENFMSEIQAAFQKAFVEKFGASDEKILPREDVIKSFDAKGAESYKIIHDGEQVGGAILKINSETNRNELVLFYIKLGCHSKGFGLSAWQEIEKLHPETKVWETYTPYFETRNIHFYVNKCGFKIVEFYNPKNPLPDPPSRSRQDTNQFSEEDFFFRFEKAMN